MKRLVVGILSLFVLLSQCRAENPPVVLKNPNTEVADAVRFLLEQPDSERPFIRFLSTYAIPTNIKVRIHLKDAKEASTLTLRDAAEFVVAFWVNSLSSESGAVVPKKITDTLYALDLRDYGWNEKAWENVSELDPYFREPWVQQHYNSVLRFESGNAIMRADWFIVHTSDIMKQVDRDIKTLPYYELLYAKLGRAPANTKEFQDFWGFDVGKVEKLLLGRGSLIKKGKSGVSRHNRQIWRSRVETGYYWITQDVKNMILGRNYIENLNAGLRKNDFDASEHIGTNKFGLQVYLLSDAKDKRLEFADNGVVTDNSDRPNGSDVPDRRIRNARSCVICHPSGINEISNHLQDVLKMGIDLHFYDKEDLIKIESFYLDPNLKNYVRDDQEFYSRSVMAVNGLDAAENASLYADLIRWYEQDLDLAQAALEVGVKPEELQERARGTISASLAAVIVGKDTMSREIWDEINGGFFGEAMLRVYGLPKIETKPQQYKPQPVKLPLWGVTVANAQMWSKYQQKLPWYIPHGKKVLVRKLVGDWAWVNYNSREAWIRTKFISKIQSGAHG